MQCLDRIYSLGVQLSLNGWVWWSLQTCFFFSSDHKKNVPAVNTDSLLLALGFLCIFPSSGSTHPYPSLLRGRVEMLAGKKLNEKRNNGKKYCSLLPFYYIFTSTYMYWLLLQWCCCADEVMWLLLFYFFTTLHCEALSRWCFSS